jgi:PKD repeat protein
LLITTATTVTFDATSSVGEPFISYTWQWDDGTADTVTTSATTTHRFATPGTRHVRLIVTNGAGSDDVIIDVGVLP